MRFVLALLAFSTAALVAQQGAPPAAKPAQIHFHEPNPFDFNDHSASNRSSTARPSTAGTVTLPSGASSDGAIVGESDSAHRPSTQHLHQLSRQRAERRGRESARLRPQARGQGRARRRHRHPIPRDRWPALDPRAAGAEAAQARVADDGPQADFWFPVSPQTEQYSGQFSPRTRTLAFLPGAAR